MVLTEDRPELRLATVDDPVPTGDRVVLRVDGCGICGSDLHVAGLMGEAGTVLGHEITGTVEAHGPDADRDRWPVGTPVVARPLVGCGACSWCGAGRPDHCDQGGLVGFDVPGGFAELVAVPGRELFRAPAGGLGPAERSLVEPLAIARHALRRGGLERGEPILVLGGGPIGLAVTAWARALGAGTILISEPEATRRDLAVTLGADRTVDPTSDHLGLAAADALGGPPGLVVECSGVPSLIDEGMSQAAVDGRVLVVGICLAQDTFLPWYGIEKELDLRFSIYYGPEDFTDTIDALESGGLDATAMITETVDLPGLPERFARMVERPDAGKVVLLP